MFLNIALLSQGVILFSCIWFFCDSPLLSLGEKLEREEVDILIKECCDPEDDDGFIPYERKLTYSSRRPDGWHSKCCCIHPSLTFTLPAFLRRVCAGPHPEMYEDW